MSDALVLPDQKTDGVLSSRSRESTFDPLEVEVSFLSPPKDDTTAVNMNFSSPSSSPSSLSSSFDARGLTLSAFHRPEQTIRLTQCDPTRTLQQEYNLYGAQCRVLGHGAFSTVRSAIRYRDGLMVAVKTIAKHEALRSRRLRTTNGQSSNEAAHLSRQQYYLEEWEILQRFQSHPHIIQLMDLFETQNEIHIVMEYCRGGELFNAIQGGHTRLGEAQVIAITAQMLLALADLHEAGIAHRDLKLENILLVNKPRVKDSKNRDHYGSSDEGEEDEHNEDETMEREAMLPHVKLCDLGMARTILASPCSSNTFSCEDACSNAKRDVNVSPITQIPNHPHRPIAQSLSMVRSNCCAAPEIRDAEQSIGDDCFSYSIDLYSVGVIAYMLLCGCSPVFVSRGNEEVISNSRSCGNISDDYNALEFDERTIEDHVLIFPAEGVSTISDQAQQLVRKLLLSNAKDTITARQALKDPWFSSLSLPIKKVVAGEYQTNKSLSVTESFELKQKLVYHTFTSLSHPVESQLLISSLQHLQPRIAENDIRTRKTKRKQKDCNKEQPPKRRSSSCLLALADLYSQVNAPTPLSSVPALLTNPASSSDDSVSAFRAAPGPASEIIPTAAPSTRTSVVATVHSIVA